MFHDLEKLGQAFGSVLAKLRAERGMSQMKLAAVADLHLNAVSKLERGEQMPSLRTVFALADAFGVPPSELVGAVEKTLRSKVK